MGLIVNRYVTMKELWEWESKYQLAKLKMLLSYLVIYDNVTDPVELYKTSKSILNHIESVPVLDANSVYFKDAYELSTSCFESRRSLIDGLIRV